MWYRTLLASGKHTSAIIALVIPTNIRRKLILDSKILPDGVEPETSEDLHITLVYLGEASEINDKKKKLIATLKLLGESTDPIKGKVSGVGFFSQPDGGEVCYASFDSAELFDFRHKLLQAVEGVGIEVDVTHGFTPHCTLVYLPNGTERPDVQVPYIDIEFKNMTVLWADEPTEVKFSMV